MGKLTTHILDATHGKPAEGVKILLYQIKDDIRHLLKETKTNFDGRTDAPLIDGNLEKGHYEIEFFIGDYFGAIIELPEPHFLNIVPIRFGVSDADAHYHVPLLASPFSYSTYRGS